MRLSDRLRLAVLAVYCGAALWCSCTSHSQALRHAVFIYWQRGKTALAFVPYWLGRSRVTPSWETLPDDAGFLPWFPPDLPIVAVLTMLAAGLVIHQLRRAGREGTPIETSPENAP
jgi:hypothetical protein